jgi:hypothetical protein
MEMEIYFYFEYRQLRTAVACKKLKEVKDYWREFDVIGIDEG